MEKLCRRKITVDMVAKEAGVSRASVYAVINKGARMNIGVGEQTQAAIVRAIEKLGYIPNNSARMLVSGRSSNIGILLNTVDVKFSRMIGKELSEKCMLHHLMPLVEYYNFDQTQERRKLEMFFSRGVDGLILIASGEDNHDLLQRFVNCHIPLVIFGRNAGKIPGAAYVGVDEESIAAEIAGFLSANRVRRAAYVTYPGSANPIKQRGVEIKTALDQAGIVLTHRFVSASYQDSLAAVRTLLALPKTERPEIVIAFTDELADNINVAALQCGVSVKEFPVMGVDGLELPFAVVPLTSVQFPVRKMIEGLWDTLEAMIERRPVQELSLYPHICLRDSTPGFHL